MIEARAKNVMQQKLALEGNLYSGDMQAIAQAENVRQWDENMAYQREQAQQAAELAERERKQNLALAFIEEGAPASFISEYLGIPQEDVNSIIASRQAQKAAEIAKLMRTGSSGSSSATAKAQKAAKTTEYLQSVLDYINTNGLDFEDFMENSADSWGITAALKPELRQMYMAQQAATTAENKTKNTNYQDVKMDIRRMAQKGSSADEIINYIERNRGGMTESEINNLFAILDAEQPNWIR
jgi:hypothetical protein